MVDKNDEGKVRPVRTLAIAALCACVLLAAVGLSAAGWLATR